MRVTNIIEANVAAQIKDPKMIKQIGIAMRHDHTVPKHDLARLGPKPEPDQIVKLWSDLLDRSLTNTDYGNISTDGRFDEWLTRLYVNGVVDWEDINGEGGDALGAWNALSIRGRLKTPHQDFNKFKSLRQIQTIVRDRDYQNELRRIKDAEVIEKHKREKKETVLIDDDRFLVTLPYNYGACYTFNNEHGYQASFCTGSSSGLRWFNNYAPDGPVISVFDKQNADEINGKWQIHAPTRQINNGNQSVRSDDTFAQLFPGLMKRIVAAMKSKAEEIKTNSTGIVSGGYDVNKAVQDLQVRFPESYASEAPKADGEEDGEQANTAGTYLVTHTPSGRQARIEGESVEDVQQKLLARHPTANIPDFTFELQPAEQ